MEVKFKVGNIYFFNINDYQIFSSFLNAYISYNLYILIKVTPWNHLKPFGTTSRWFQRDFTCSQKNFCSLCAPIENRNPLPISLNPSLFHYSRGLFPLRWKSRRTSQAEKKTAICSYEAKYACIKPGKDRGKKHPPPLKRLDLQ